MSEPKILEIEFSDPQKSLIKINFNKIPRINCNTITYNEFFRNFMEPNDPVVLTTTSVQWICRTDWITKTLGNSEINYVALKSNIINQKVPVANCSKTYFNSHEKIEMDFYDYLNYWQNRSSEEEDEKSLLYLKDWHLKASMPDYSFYSVPQHFASDWLNEFLIDSGRDDYRFVYMGPKGSWTPFHTDVFGSFSWSTNIFGLKKWILLPPKQEQKLKDSLGNDPFSVDEMLLNSRKVKYFVVYQKANESLFVPSGWYHQVWNITDTISVNHNWFNGCNIEIIWKCLRDSFNKVVAEIEDLRAMNNFDEHCQTMLRATFGLNFDEFLELIEHIYRKRKLQICSVKGFKIFDTFVLNRQHCMYDILSINKVLTAMKIEMPRLTNETVKRAENVLKDITQLINCFA